MSYDLTKYYGKISNSGHDQRGRYKDGAPGDQTGTEWQVINWYSRPWKCVLRYPNEQVGQKLAELAIKAANNNMIGYDQNQRTTYWTQLSKVNYDPAQITVPCEADCSAGVCSNVKAVGKLMGITALANIPITSTYYMRNTLKTAGFQVLTGSAYTSSYENLKPGDILLNDGHHTAMYVGKKPGVIKTITNKIISNKNSADTTQNYSASLVGTYIVNANGGLNLRTGASTSKSIITIIPDGKEVICYGYYNADQTTKWLYVKYNGHTGYASEKYLDKKDETSAAKNPVNGYPFTGICIGNGVAVRTWAGTNYAKIVSHPVLNKGDKVIVEKSIKAIDGKTWYYVKIDNKYHGFVFAEYVKRA